MAGAAEGRRDPRKNRRPDAGRRFFVGLAFLSGPYENAPAPKHGATALFTGVDNGLPLPGYLSGAAGAAAPAAMPYGMMRVRGPT